MKDKIAWSVVVVGFVMELFIASVEEWIPVPQISFHIGKDGAYFMKEG